MNPPKSLPLIDMHQQQPKQLQPFDYNQIVPGSWDNDNLDRVCEIWSLTKEELDQLRFLRDRLSDLSYWKNEPHHVLWFMRGPLGYSYSSIEHHFRKMVQWRQENDIDHIFDRYHPSSLFTQNTACSILKDYDRDGDPIYVERGGAMNPLQMLKQSSKEEMIQYAIWIREVHMRGPWTKDYELKHGHPVKNITIIYDLKGMSSGHINPRVLDVFKDIMKLTKDYYSAPVKRMIIIRAPAIFRIGWSIVKHIFPASARKKMTFAGAENYLEVLEQYVDLEVLPPCIYPGGRGCTAPGMPPMIGELGREEKEMGEDFSRTSTNLSESSRSEEDSTNDDEIRVGLGVTCKSIVAGKWEKDPLRGIQCLAD